MLCVDWLYMAVYDLLGIIHEFGAVKMRLHSKNHNPGGQTNWEDQYSIPTLL